MHYKQFIDATGLSPATFYHWRRQKRQFLTIMIDGVPQMHKINLSQSLGEIFREHHTETLAQHARGVGADLGLRRMQRWHGDPSKQKLLKAYLAGVIHGNKKL